MKCNDCDDKGILEIDGMVFCVECADEYEGEK